jgi:actin-like ATPase involved in cell morphogenesis
MSVHDDLKMVITSAGLNEENAERARLIFENMVLEKLETLTEHFEQLIDEKFTEHVDNITEAIDAYLAEEMAPAVDEAVGGTAELRNYARTRPG